MVAGLIRKIFGSKNDRELKRMGKTVNVINSLEKEFSELSDDALRAKTDEFKTRLNEGVQLDDLLAEAFAVVREAGKRTLGMRHFDVQMIGGITLHEGRIAEMRTGEGKTLMSTLPSYLNALTGNGVFVITVNDYLATRDAGWMEPLYDFLGLSVGVVVPDQQPQDKKAAYDADITYGTNNEFGFDYLRDNMAFRPEDKFQRSLNFAVVDEVDSILIDEARTPLIISGAVEDSSKLYIKVNKLIPTLKEETEGQEGHYLIDEKTRSVELTEAGHQLVEEMMVNEGLLEENDSLYNVSNIGLLHHVQAALKAHAIFQKDVDYIVQNKQIVIVDEHTGRTMPGRRWSEGIHQAVEAKEGVSIQNESQTLASTTFQNYFRLFNKLSGMTGTADTEAFEFRQTYGLDVVVIPTNKTMIRKDMEDLIYLSKEEKYDAIVEDVRENIAVGRPVLVGTATIDASEDLSHRLKKEKIKHRVLNAKHHAQEAEIIADAGRPGSVTIATNMAGRGTDIVLGGSWQAEIDKQDNPPQEKVDKIKAEWQQRHDAVLDTGGLCILGTERHESRRIDNQLRGRSGRQGDAGSSRFYLSLEDDLMRIFASERVKGFMQAMGMQKGEAIEHRMVSNAIEKAQRKVEGRNFDIRKQLLEYDDVANDQRQIIYSQRNEIMEADNITETIDAVRADVVNDLVGQFIPPQSLEEQWDIEGLEKQLQAECNATLPIREWLDQDDNLYEETLREKILETVVANYRELTQQVGEEIIYRHEKETMLRCVDERWKEHLAAMDHLRQGIGLRGYAQKNPKQEYKREAFELFENLLETIKADVIRILCNTRVLSEEEVAKMEAARRQAEAEMAQRMKMEHAGASAMSEGEDQEAGSADKEQPFTREERKVGRNEPCPCGSGKKYKQCHGKLD